MAATPLTFRKGVRVYMYNSDTKELDIEGFVEEVLEDVLTVGDSTEFPAGSLRVVSKDGSGALWIRPEHAHFCIKKFDTDASTDADDDDELNDPASAMSADEDGAQKAHAAVAEMEARLLPGCQVTVREEFAATPKLLGSWFGSSLGASTLTVGTKGVVDEITESGDAFATFEGWMGQSLVPKAALHCLQAVVPEREKASARSLGPTNLRQSMAQKPVTDAEGDVLDAGPPDDEQLNTKPAVATGSGCSLKSVASIDVVSTKCSSSPVSLLSAPLDVDGDCEVPDDGDCQVQQPPPFAEVPPLLPLADDVHVQDGSCLESTDPDPVAHTEGDCDGGERVEELQPEQDSSQAADAPASSPALVAPASDEDDAQFDDGHSAAAVAPAVAAQAPADQLDDQGHGSARPEDQSTAVAPVWVVQAPADQVDDQDQDQAAATAAAGISDDGAAAAASAAASVSGAGRGSGLLAPPRLASLDGSPRSVSPSTSQRGAPLDDLPSEPYDRTQQRVLIIGTGFGMLLNPAQFNVLRDAGYQIRAVETLPNPETPNFQVHQFLPTIKKAIDEFQPHAIACASKGGVFMVALWQTGLWAGPTLFINRHPMLCGLPKGVPVVLCHGSNDEYYQYRREDIENLVRSGEANRCLLYYTANSGPLGRGFTREGDRHNMQSLVQYDCLPRLLDAAMCGSDPTMHLMNSWNRFVTEERLKAEQWLGFRPEDLRRLWQSEEQRGFDETITFDVARGTEEYAKVETLFKAQPTVPRAYTDMNPGMWQTLEFVRMERVENGMQEDGNASPYCRALERGIQAQGLRFRPGLHTKWAFHGSSAVEEIVSNPIAGFQPLMSGSRAAALWGPGTYFARDAKYVYDGGFCKINPDGTKTMLLCLLMSGIPCLGDPNHRGVLPIRQGRHRYNSSVDSISNPEIYVTQTPGAAYPAYVITFRS